MDFRLTHLVPVLDQACDDLVAEALGHPLLPEERWWRRLRLPLVLGRVGADHLASGLALLALQRWEGLPLGEVMPALYVAGTASPEGGEGTQTHQFLATPLWRLAAEPDADAARKTVRDAFLSVLTRLPRETLGSDLSGNGLSGSREDGEPSGPRRPAREPEPTSAASTRAPEAPPHVSEPAGPIASSQEARPCNGTPQGTEASAEAEEAAPVSLLLAEIDSWFAVGDERHRAVASRRIFTDTPDTLDVIGADFGVTRERIRQIHKQVEQDLRSWLDSPFGASLRTHVGSVSADLGAAAPLDALRELRPEHSHTVASLGIPLERVVLTLLPGHRTAGDWLVSEAADAAEERLAGLLDSGAALPLDEALATAHEAGIHSAYARAWLETLPRTRFVNNRLVRWGRSLPDKAFAVLSALGRPLPVAELIAHIGGDFNEAGFRDRVHNDDRIMRRDRRVFGLRAWGGEEYLGVEETMRRELERAGGEMHVTELAEALASRFDISDKSVRAMAAGSEFARPRPGWVGLLDDAALDVPGSYRPRRPVERTRRCFRDTEGLWWLRLDVNVEHLRGSGFPIPSGFASWAGMYPGVRMPVLIGDREAVAPWKNQPLMSSVRPLLLDGEAAEGDHAFLTLSGNRVVCRVFPADPSSTDPLSRALHLAGVAGPASGPGGVAVLAAAIGLTPDATAEQIREHLADRGDSDVLAALGTVLDEVPG